MTWPESQFEVCQDVGELEDSWIVVDVGAAPDKEAVMVHLADSLGFPDYFGMNWDATVDCLSDLSWLRGRRVVLRHAELPLAGSPELGHYLYVLVAVLNRWSERRENQLRVCFASDLRPTVEAHLIPL